MLLQARLRFALTEAMRGHDPVALTAIRSALAAIDNAGAVEVGASPHRGSSESIAGGVHGLGAAEVQRLPLTEGQIVDIVRSEILDRNQAAAEYDRLGRSEHAVRLRTESEVLDRILADPAPG